jgi:acyl-CoA reductase-like NAD-dependent aldehyde dehydrogenase
LLISLILRRYTEFDKYFLGDALMSADFAPAVSSAVSAFLAAPRQGFDARAFEAGTIRANSHNVGGPQAAFGGHRQSCIGRERDRAVRDAHLENQRVSVRYD